jgi:hypothetical protein
MAQEAGDSGSVTGWAEAEPVLGAWYRRARESQFAHYKAASRYGALARLLGVPGVVLSAATGTALFATLEKNDASPTLRLVLGLVSVLAATLAALQTFLGFGQRADKHRAAASAYGSIRREIEQYQALPPAFRDGVEAAMERLRARLDEVSTSAPDVPARTWAKAQSAIAETERPEGFTRSTS